MLLMNIALHAQLLNIAYDVTVSYIPTAVNCQRFKHVFRCVIIIIILTLYL